MKRNSNRHIVAGSEREALPGARVAADLSPDERFEVTLRLRARADAPSAAEGRVHDDCLPSKRRYLSRPVYAERHGADAADMSQVAAFAAASGLSVVESSAARRSMVLSGTATAMMQAFGVTLKRYEHPHGSYRGRTGPVTVPNELAEVIQGVFGLDDRPQAVPHFQVWQPPTGVAGGAAPRAAAPSSFTPPQLAKLYGFPATLDGSGQTIGIIELGGGFKPADLKAYFTALGLPVPAVKMVAVDGGRNQPSNANSADGEVMLDIEVAAAIAPKAAIVVYFAPNTNQGFLDAITMAVHDAVHKPSVISISWGSPESAWTDQAMTQFDQAFQAAAAMGVTVCCAAGDNGSADGVAGGGVHVDFPASSPFALGCGGTRLSASGQTIRSETVWNDGPNSATGGGVSAVFARPAYQSGAGVPVGKVPAGFVGRGVPDVAGNADPATGYQVRVDGQNMVIGGTSAVAPLWAGWVALMNQHLGHAVGYLNPLLYGSLAGHSACRDITTGNNGSYQAGPGWDPCTGWGSPDGVHMLQALKG